MFNFLKTTDDKIIELGYTKTKDDRYVIRYERPLETYTQIVEILKRDFRRSVVQSYYKELLHLTTNGSICVGLSYKEMKLFTKKMKEMKLDKY